MNNNKLNKEIIDILDNVIYWETCPEDYKVRIEAIRKQLTLTDRNFSEGRVEVCLICKKLPQSAGSEYCGECIDNGEYIK